MSRVLTKVIIGLTGAGASYLTKKGFDRLKSIGHEVPEWIEELVIAVVGLGASAAASEVTSPKAH